LDLTNIDFNHFPEITKSAFEVRSDFFSFMECRLFAEKTPH